MCFSAKRKTVLRYLSLSLSCSLQVHWVQQQHEKKRRKRDFANQPSISPFSQFIGEIAPSAEHPAHGQPHYRAIPSVTFPDPLFREQWYLVSTEFLQKKIFAAVHLFLTLNYSHYIFKFLQSYLISQHIRTNDINGARYKMVLQSNIN